MPSLSYRAALVVVSSMLTAACGTVVDAQHGASTGSGGSTSTTTSTTGSGGAPASCGGKAGTPCGPDQFCHYDASSSCGLADATGTCQPEPQGCLDDCPGVCGCDGKFYCNACDANAAGVDASDQTGCMGQDAYQAWNLFTNVSRYAILKSSPDRNLCFRIIVVTGSGTGLSGLTGNVSVESALVTHEVADCTISGPPLPVPSGPTYPAVSGMGTVDMATMLPAGCTTTIAAKLVFSPGAPWVPPSETFQAQNLPITGGCP
jgi:hypothetical protein